MSTTIRRSGPAVKRAHDPWNSADREPLDRAGPAGPAQQGEERDRGEAAEEGRSAETDPGREPGPGPRTRPERATSGGSPRRRHGHARRLRLSRSRSRRPPAPPRRSSEPEPVAWAPSARRHAEARSRALTDPGRARTRPRRDRGDRPAAPGLPAALARSAVARCPFALCLPRRSTPPPTPFRATSVSS